MVSNLTFSLALILCVVTFGFAGAHAIIWMALLVFSLWFYQAPLWFDLTIGLLSIVFLIRPIRTNLISHFIMKGLKSMRVLPVISNTERVALDAGVVWVESEFFSGKPNFNKILREPYPELSEVEKNFLNNQVNILCEMIND